MQLSDARLRMILAEELEKVHVSAKGAPEHIAKLRAGQLTPALSAAVEAMKRAVAESEAAV